MSMGDIGVQVRWPPILFGVHGTRSNTPIIGSRSHILEAIYRHFATESQRNSALSQHQ
jgi:hypothetical protein